MSNYNSSQHSDMMLLIYKKQYVMIKREIARIKAIYKHL